MKDEKRRIKEDKKRSKELTKNRAEISRRARMTGKEIAVFREPPHLISISLGLMCLGVWMFYASLAVFIGGGFVLTVMGTVIILLGLKVASFGERLNTYLDPKRGRVRIVRLVWFKAVESRTIMRSEIVEARVMDDVDLDGDQMFGAEFVLNDGTCVPLAVCRTSFRGEWEKSIGRINTLLGR